jgi:hypothetical protein
LAPMVSREALSPGYRLGTLHSGRYYHGVATFALGKRN